MSRTDKTRPWWVRLADTPMVTSLPVHDHRFGPCTLPDRITADSASTSHRPTDPDRAACHRAACYWAACYWGGTPGHPVWRDTRGGHREWHHFCRQERRRSRHRARRALRAGHREG